MPGKFLQLLGYLVLSRLGIYIPLGGVNREAFIGNLDQNSLLSTLDSFSGGGIGRLGICSLGIVPFINAQIVFQLLAQIYPKLQELQKREGEAGRKKILQYTRYASVGFAIVQVRNVIINMAYDRVKYIWKEKTVEADLYSFCFTGLHIFNLGLNGHSVSMGKSILKLSILESITKSIGDTKNYEGRILFFI